MTKFDGFEPQVRDWFRGLEVPFHDGPVAAGLLTLELELGARAAAFGHCASRAGTGEDRLVEGHAIAFLFGGLRNQSRT